MFLILFLICLFASTIGAIVGAGGGVMIKPITDALGLLPVSTVSFLSGCTVLAMSCCSLLRSRNNGIELRMKTTVPLAVGAALGGILGKLLFELVRSHFGSEALLGAIQAFCLAIFTSGVLLYIRFKSRLPSKQIQNGFLAFLIGAVLGCLSAFLGIGGGSSNVAVLFFFFSMDAKQAAKNSLFIIMCSQIASLLLAIVTHTVPAFSWPDLIAMTLGGVSGALIGGKLSTTMKSRSIETLMIIFLAVIVCINIFNFIKFAF